MAGSRTYLPTLIKILQHICKYIGDHRDTILRVIGDENADALDAVVLACNVLLPLLQTFDVPIG